jgi:Flp pilus assembly pilin Flp
MSDWEWGREARLQEGGQALAEYSLILAFIAAVCIIALGALGLALAGHLGALATALP